MEANQSFVIKAVLSFPNLFEENDEGKYGVQLANLSPAAVEKLESQGVDVKFKDDDKYGRGQFINTTSKYPYHTVDSEGTDLAGANIGYGTVVRAQCSTYNWTYGKKQGVGVRVIKLMVDEIVEAAKAEVDLNDFDEAL